MKEDSTNRQVGPWVLLIALIVGLGANTVYRAGYGSKLRTDLPVYLVGAERVLAGEDPLYVRSEARQWPYVYPPTFAVGMIPLTALPLKVAAVLWYVLSVGALALGALCVRRAQGRAGPFRWVDDGVPLALVLIPCASALTRGQVGPLLLGLLGAAALCLARRRDGWAGALIALATAIKLTPGLVIVGLLVARRWRAFGASLAGLVVWLVLVPAPFLGLGGAVSALGHYGERIVGAYVDDPLAFTPDSRAEPVEYPMHIGTNQSVASQIARRTSGWPGRLLLGALVLCVLGAALALGSIHLRTGAGGAGTTIACAALFAAPLLVAPIAWHHHHVLLFPALAVVVGWRERRWVAPALIAFAVLSLLHFGATPLRPFGLLGWGTLVVYAGLVAEAWARRADSEGISPSRSVDY